MATCEVLNLFNIITRRQWLIKPGNYLGANTVVIWQRLKILQDIKSSMLANRQVPIKTQNFLWNVLILWKLYASWIVCVMEKHLTQLTCWWSVLDRKVMLNVRTRKKGLINSSSFTWRKRVDLWAAAWKWQQILKIKLKKG